MNNKKLLTKLYLISPDHIKVNEFSKVLESVLKTGLVSCFQLWTHTSTCRTFGCTENYS